MGIFKSIIKGAGNIANSVLKEATGVDFAGEVNSLLGQIQAEQELKREYNYCMYRKEEYMKEYNLNESEYENRLSELEKAVEELEREKELRREEKSD